MCLRPCTSRELAVRHDFHFHVSRRRDLGRVDARESLNFAKDAQESVDSVYCGQHVIRDTFATRQFHVSRDDDVAESPTSGHAMFVKVRNLTNITITEQALQLVIVCAVD